ncbi:MAG: CBS domain-containing protein, partial [Planctomycetota bacterium]
AAFAMGCQRLGLLPEGGTPATFALAGMAGVIAAVAHCPLTAFLLVFEITADYQVILPTMLVAILATTVSQLVFRDSIYALWLRDRGIKMGTYSDLTLLRRMTCHDVPLTPAVIVHAEDPAARLIELAEDYAVVDYVVADEADRYVGMVVGQDVRATLVQREAIPLMIVSELMRTNLPTVSPHQTLDVVLEQFAKHDVASLAVVDVGDRVKGVITRSRLMRQYQQSLSEKG